MTRANATRPPVPESLLPLKPVETLMLTMLAAGERHGYGIRQDVLEHTNGAIELEAGTLYRHIRHLESDDLIEPSADRRGGTDDDPRRIYYRLTPFGRRVLTAELIRLRELVRLAEARRIIAPVRA
jgi:PadR family transcriptional regulator